MKTPPIHYILLPTQEVHVYLVIMMTYCSLHLHCACMRTNAQYQCVRIYIVSILFATTWLKREKKTTCLNDVALFVGLPGKFSCQKYNIIVVAFILNNRRSCNSRDRLDWLDSAGYGCNQLKWVHAISQWQNKVLDHGFALRTTYRQAETHQPQLGNKSTKLNGQRGGSWGPAYNNNKA